MFLLQPFSNGLTRVPRNKRKGGQYPASRLATGEMPYNLQAEAVVLFNAGLIIMWQTETQFSGFDAAGHFLYL